MPSSACYRDLRALHSFPTRRSSDLRGSVWASAILTGPRPRMARAYPAAILSHWPAFDNSDWSACGKSALVAASPASSLLVSAARTIRSEEHTSELQSLRHLVCRLLLAIAISELCTLSLHDALPIFGDRCGRRRY